MELCSFASCADDNMQEMNFDNENVIQTGKSFHVYEDKPVQNCIHCSVKQSLGRCICEKDICNSRNSDILDAVPSSVNDELSSKRERRFLRRNQRKISNINRRNGRSEKRNARSCSINEDTHSNKEALPLGSKPITQIRLPRGDKENISPFFDQKRLKRLRSDNGCCSPVAKVMKRMFSPMRSRSPLLRRESRVKRKVSYTEPSLIK